MMHLFLKWWKYIFQVSQLDAGQDVSANYIVIRVTIFQPYIRIEFASIKWEKWGFDFVDSIPQK